jgi:hypothetical protein
MALKLLFFSRPPSGDSYVAQRGRHPVAAHDLTNACNTDDSLRNVEVLVEHERQAPRKTAALRADWRAATEFLKLTFSDYRNSTRIDVSATASASPVIITEEQRMELIERRNRLLELRGKPPLALP